MRSSRRASSGKLNRTGGDYGGITLIDTTILVEIPIPRQCLPGGNLAREQQRVADIHPTVAIKVFASFGPGLEHDQSAYDDRRSGGEPWADATPAPANNIGLRFGQDGCVQLGRQIGRAHV